MLLEYMKLSRITYFITWVFLLSLALPFTTNQMQGLIMEVRALKHLNQAGKLTRNELNSRLIRSLGRVYFLSSGHAAHNLVPLTRTCLEWVRKSLICFSHSCTKLSPLIVR